MKEKKDIVSSFNSWVIEGKKCALATVVKVEGSSYRRPGARMLISEDGKLSGAISGGCLEGEILKKRCLSSTNGSRYWSPTIQWMTMMRSLE